jgi:hypothetical protein
MLAPTTTAVSPTCRDDGVAVPVTLAVPPGVLDGMPVPADDGLLPQ